MYRGRHIRRRRLWVVVTWALIILAAGLLLAPFVEPYRLETEKIRLTSADLPTWLEESESADTHSLRVVFVSDIHQGGWPYYTAGRVQGLVSEINKQKADLVLLGGDYASSPSETIAFFRALPAIKANIGVYAVLGEADRPEDAQGLSELRDVMKSKGITLLVNEVASVPYGMGRVKVAGLDEPQRGEVAISRVAGQVSASDYVILLAHNPSLIDDANRLGAQDWYDLGFFGHTHGNQFFGNFNPLGIATDVTSSSYRKGWVEGSRNPTLISRGVGTKGLPVRLGCAPQLHVIDISRSGS